LRRSIAVSNEPILVASGQPPGLVGYSSRRHVHSEMTIPSCTASSANIKVAKAALELGNNQTGLPADDAG
jgi:hypothetical protein